jgi:Ser/Thr protein kinase RdoA (MazF antagonist)
VTTPGTAVSARAADDGCGSCGPDAALHLIQAVCEIAGTPADDARVVATAIGENTVVLLPSAGLVARVADLRHLPRLQKELLVARFLDGCGIPVAAPAEAPPCAQLEVFGDRVVTWWDYLSGPPAGFAQLGSVLRAVHELPVPRVGVRRLAVPRLEVFARLRRELRNAPGLPDRERTVLLGRASGLERRFEQSGLAREVGVVLHGDAHPANTVSVDGQARLLDFEDVALGPALYDLRIAFGFHRLGWIGEKDLDAFLDAYGQPVLAELECLRGLRALTTPHPGFYRCTVSIAASAHTVDDQLARAARLRAERWYLASSRAATGFLPAAAAPVASMKLPAEPDPAILDVFSALAWFRQARLTLLHLARAALDERRYESALELASAAISAVTTDAADPVCGQAAELLLAAARAAGDVQAEARGLDHLAALLALDGDLEQARRMLVAALALLRHARDRVGVASSAIALGLMHLRGGDLPMAGRWLTVAVGAAERCGDQDLLARARGNLGHAVLLSDPRRRVHALGLLASAGRRHLESGDLAAYAACARLIASAVRRHPGGDSGPALRFARHAVEAAEAAGSATGHEYAEVGRCVEAAGTGRARGHGTRSRCCCSSTRPRAADANARLTRTPTSPIPADRWKPCSPRCRVRAVRQRQAVSRSAR